MTRQRRILAATAASGVTAAVVAASLVWSWLHQPSEVEQLVEILAGKSLPDAAWAFRRLEEVSDKELRNLVPYLKDSRTSALKAVYQNRLDWDRRGLALPRLVNRILVSRIPAQPVPIDHGPIDSPEAWDQQRWDLEIERLLAERKQPTAGSRTISTGWQLLGSRPVQPPAVSVREIAGSDDARRIAKIVNLLKGEDAALAVWLVERLRSSPDGALDGLLAHASSAEATGVRLFYSENDPVARAEGFSLGHLVRMLLAERVEDDVLCYNVRQYEASCLAADVEAAWVKHRGRGNSFARAGGEPRS